MKRYLTFHFLLLISSLSIAQISIEKDSSEQMGSINDFEIIAKNNITNASNDDVDMRWIRVSQEFSEGWLAATCDNETCWFPERDSSQFTIPANGSSNLDIYFYNQNTDGNGEVKILLYEVAKGRSSGDTLVYQAYTNKPVGLDNSISSFPQLQVYPNPVVDQLHVRYQANGAAYKIYSNGTLIGEGDINAGSDLDFSQYQSGQYYLELSNDNYRSVVKVNKQ